jgi:hypothetical protein
MVDRAIGTCLSALGWAEIVVNFESLYLTHISELFSDDNTNRKLKSNSIQHCYKCFNQSSAL